MSILAMNQNVFSSLFVGKKISKEAKRAIEAEMIVPASAIEMTYDEMEYVDGGFVRTQRFYNIGAFFVEFGFHGVAGASAATGLIVAAVFDKALSAIPLIGIIVGLIKGAVFLYSLLGAIEQLIKFGHFDVYYTGIKVFGAEIELLRYV